MEDVLFGLNIFLTISLLVMKGVPVRSTTYPSASSRYGSLSFLFLLTCALLMTSSHAKAIAILYRLELPNRGFAVTWCGEIAGDNSAISLLVPTE